MSNLVRRIFVFALKVVLGLFAALFAVSLLAAALLALVLSVLKAVITGRRPTPAVVFGRFQQFSQQGMWPASRAREASAKAATGQVVDVEVREIREEKRLP